MAGQASGVVGNYIKSSYQNSAKEKLYEDWLTTIDVLQEIIQENPERKEQNSLRKRLQAMVLELQKLQIHQFLVEYRKL